MSSIPHLQMMESSFTGLKYVKKDETSVHERIMEQYINEKLGGTQKKAPEGMRGSGHSFLGYTSARGKARVEPTNTNNK